MGVSHLAPGAMIFESGIDPEAALGARIAALRALESVAVERGALSETLAAIRELRLEAEAELY